MVYGGGVVCSWLCGGVRVVVLHVVVMVTVTVVHVSVCAALVAGMGTSSMLDSCAASSLWKSEGSAS